MNEAEEKAFADNLAETNRCIDHLVRINKWLIIVAITAFICITVVFGMTLLYLYQYNFSTTTTTVQQSSEGGSDTNYIGMDGSIYGQADSDNSK